MDVYSNQDELCAQHFDEVILWLAIYIVQNYVFHERINHIQVDFICYVKSIISVLLSQSMCFVQSQTCRLSHLENLRCSSYICNKLDMYNVYALTWEGVLCNKLVCQAPLCKSLHIILIRGYDMGTINLYNSP